ncbi:MAG: glycosyltransferase family 2 protein [Candidatus Aureabacteria bacterium]|nr:glycosyltransferase family 2 protein [Candidatus Auribacterota bacterium]
MDRGISIVLPAYNEEENIGHAVGDIVGYFKEKKEKYEVIVVDDGSSDMTGKLANRLENKYKQVRVISHPKNEGYGKSLKDGFDAARYEYLFFTDCDRQFDISSLDIMFPLIKTGVVDLIIGYRLKRKDAFLRRFLSWGYNTLVGFVFDLNVKDIDCAFKIFDKKIFEKINITSKKFFVNTEILVKAHYYGYNMIEVGVPHFPRTAGKSTVSLKYIPRTLKELFRVWREVRKLKRKKRATF